MKRSRLAGLFSMLAGVILLPVIGFSQGQERSISKVSWRNEPIKIVKLKTKGKAISFAKEFSEEDDWLRGLTVTVENISDKAIARIELALSFPRPEGPSETIPTYTVKMSYGRDPSDADYGGQKQVLLGERVEVSLLEANLPFIKTDLESLGYPEKITSARIMVDTVTFIDGTMWAGDEILYPDPANPKQKLNPKFPLWEKFKPPPNQSAFPGTSPAPRFENASFRSVNASVRLNHSKGLFGKFALLQDPTLPCNTVWVATHTFACGDSGSGCTYKQDVFQDGIEFLGVRNARKTLDSVRCQRSDDTFCTPTPISNFKRAPCGVLVAGTCGGWSDYITYPSTGCITGLFFGGPCRRSNAFISRCDSYDDESCTCPGGTSTSPIVIDVDHSGFSMTDAAGGVVFNILNDGVPLAISWTAAGSTNALLVLDRNGNGTIDNGEELFGDITPQPASAARNGFLALTVYDQSVSGGNGNGKIDRHDAIFSQLRLWQDYNHNGVSESSELRPLSGLLRAIDLDYKESRRIDQHGNQFRYRAKVYDVRGAHAGRWAWDVFLTVQ